MELYCDVKSYLFGMGPIKRVFGTISWLMSPKVIGLLAIAFMSIGWDFSVTIIWCLATKVILM